MCSIRNLLENDQDLNSSGEEEDEFVPSKNDLLSSSEEEGQDEDGPNIDDQVSAKKFRYVATGSGNSRSKRKSYSSARTQRRTPAKKVMKTRRTLIFRHEITTFSPSLSYFYRSRLERPKPPVTPRPASPSGPCRPNSRLTSWRKPEPGELTVDTSERTQETKLSLLRCRHIGW